MPDPSDVSRTGRTIFNVIFFESRTLTRTVSSPILASTSRVFGNFLMHVACSVGPGALAAATVFFLSRSVHHYPDSFIIYVPNK